MKALERRLLALEGRRQAQGRELTPDEQQSAIARLLAADGLTEAEAIALFGGVPAFVYHLLTRSDPD